MHLLSAYALATGSKIGKPFILKKFYPVDADKYITIQNSSGMAIKCHDYLQEVVNFLLPKLTERGYKIIQIGAEGEKEINGAIHLQGKTTINQTAYILDGSYLHLGNDSFAIHMCSAFNVPTVGLYSISYPSICGPYWNNKHINLCPPDHKASFNPNESPKTVNQIKIEEIVQSCNTLLFNENDILIKTEYIGRRYNDKVIETLPDQIIRPEFFQGHTLNIRFDYLPDYKDLLPALNNLSLRPCALVTNYALNIDPFVQVKKNIAAVIYDVSNGADVEFVKSMQKHGIPFVCVFDESSETKSSINDIRFQLMDYCHVDPFSRKSKDSPAIPATAKVKTNRILLANQKIYSGRTAQLQDLSSTSFNEEQSYLNILDKETFKEDLDYCFIYSIDNSAN